jgi:nicotinate-nucleotide adenylyltransferase
MLRLAIADRPSLTLSSLHITPVNVETSWEIFRTYVDRHGQLQIYLLMGCDAFNRLPQWDQPHRAIELFRIGVFPRRGCQLPDLERLHAILPGISERISILDIAPVDISSSEVRQRIRQGLPIRGLVPKNVADYIFQHGLYRGQLP